ncbi:MAG TPA: flippase-like domain-containing protein [Spirochaetes bacterium]|nr:flippase-like domain-containing protein [Spirochaetota bacterium]
MIDLFNRLILFMVIPSKSSIILKLYYIYHQLLWDEHLMNKYRWGLLAFIAISLATLVLLFISDDVQLTGFINSLKQFDLLYLPLALIFLALHLLSDGVRLKILAWGMGESMKVRTGVVAGLANEFLSAITPFQSGGQPFEIFIFRRSGLPLGKCGVISYFRMATSLVFLSVTGSFTLIYYSELTRITSLNYFYIYGAVFISYFIALTYFTVYKPRFAKKITFIGMGFLKKIKVMKEETYFSKQKYIIKEVNTFNHHIRSFFFKQQGLIALSTLVTFFTWTFKYLIAYFLLLGLGVQTSILEVIFYQSAIHFVNYAIPTPGASGTSEWVANSIFRFLSDDLNNKVLLNSFVTLWRFATYHIIVIIAGFATLGSLREWIKSKEKEEEEKSYKTVA